MITSIYYEAEPETAQIILLKGSALLITSIDFTTSTGTFSMFDSVEDAYKEKHRGSLNQYPEGHKENCPVCSER